ncbi:ATP-binding protein [Streptomycetaceae bacterium NBC_01309]
MQKTPETLVVELDGSAGSVRGARQETHRFLADAGRIPRIAPDTARDVLMVVGELVANACRHAPGPCRLSVEVVSDSVDVAVQDSGSSRLGPARRREPPGYGLWIVARLTKGIHVLPIPGGKVVRASVPLGG